MVVFHVYIYPGMPLAVIYRIKLETPDMVCVYSTNTILIEEFIILRGSFL